MASLLFPPGYQTSDQNGKPLSGAKVYIYDAGTTTPASVFLDDDLTSPATLPVETDSAGRLVNLYVSAGQLYKVDVDTAADVSVFTSDNIPPFISDSGGNVPITSGGTGQSTAALARGALGAASASDVSTLSSTVGSISTPQAAATWETGTGTGETVVSPAKVKAAIEALEATQSGVPDFVLEDQRTAGVSGQSITTSWVTVNINTEKYDPDSNVSLAANLFTTTKDCWIEWEVPGYSGSDFSTRVVDNSDSSVVGIGTGGRGLTSGGDRAVVSHSRGGTFIPAGTYKIEIKSVLTAGTAGRAMSIQTEIYARLRGWLVHGS